MDTIVTILLLLAVGLLPCLGILFLLKRRKMPAGRMGGPLAGPRYRDGAVTYTQFRGARSHIEVEGPAGGQSARYQRRHARKQHTQTKPWEK
jgi:hypothetical protein